MLRAAEGVFRKGRIELVEIPDDVHDETRVIVMFLESPLIDLRSRNIDRAHAAELRARMATFAEDWESPEMDIYDDYDAARTKAR